LAKLVQHADIRHARAVAQTRKGSPRAMFGQQFHQQVEGMHGRQQSQQVNPKQLGRREKIAPAWAGGLKEK
jgi:hypothetical protein